MVRKQNDLGKDDIKQLVKRLAIPSMLAQFVNVLYSIVDRMYIGNIKDVGEIALAGAGVCGPIVTLISSFAFLVGIGGAPLLAMRMGEEDQEGAENILANCFVMLLVLSGILTALAIAFREPMLMFFGASEQTFPYANSYLTFYVAGTVFAILTAGLNQFITCQGFANEAMLTTIIGAIMNIILDPVFIFVLEWVLKVRRLQPLSLRLVPVCLFSGFCLATEHMSASASRDILPELCSVSSRLASVHLLSLPETVY